MIMECKADNSPFQSPAMMSLEELGIKHKTAKVPHGYLPIYERFFRDMEVIRLLEIGVADGASMKMWREYFPKASINGVDKHLIIEPLDGVNLFESDILEIHLLAALNKYFEFDIIIDDASHIAAEQIGAFRGLWHTVKPGGLYVIEDLFTLYDPVWNPKEWNIIEHIHNQMENILTGGNSISEIHYYGRNDINGILFLRKRKEPFRIQPLEEFNM